KPTGESPVMVYLGGVAETTRRTMANHLTTIAQLAGFADPQTMPWHLLRYEHVKRIRQLLIECAYAPSTANVMLSALRGVLRDCWRLKLLNCEDYQLAIEVEPVRGSRVPRGRALKHGETSKLFQVCADDATPAGRRDAAIAALCYGSGL